MATRTPWIRAVAAVYLWYPLPLPAAEVTIPAGTELQIRLKAPVSSNNSKAKDPVEAIVIAPVIVDGQVAIPAGATVRGEVSEIQAASQTDQRALLGLSFSGIANGAGKQTPLKARLVDVDNARESVDDSGRVVGILASETLAARINQGIDKVSQRNSGLGQLLELAKGAVLKQQPSGEIHFDSGVDLSLKLLQPLKLADSPASDSGLAPVSSEQALYELVNGQPFQTVAERPPKPSDVTNLMFIGAEEELLRTFKAAGWSLADETNATSVLETVAAVAEMRGYKEAPMSRLLLDGRRSDFDFQKGNNTFAKRHHLRIWRRSDTFDDKPVWVCSSTHDIGIDFSQENRTFIHKIDPEIDRERAKVVSDLLFTKQVKSLALVERPNVPKQTQNATGDDILTDGRMAVLILR